MEVPEHLAVVETLGCALSSFTRIELLVAIERTAAGGVRLGELSKAFGLAPSTITHHIACLQRAGLVAVSQEGRERVARCLPGRWSGIEGLVKGIWTRGG